MRIFVCITNPATQPASQPTDQPTNQTTTQPTNQPNNQPTNQPNNQPTNQTNKQPHQAESFLGRDRHSTNEAISTSEGTVGSLLFSSQIELKHLSL
jgi:outer membrane biosynthesis protein TonB